MALKALMLKRKIDDKKKELETLRQKEKDFAEREAELEASIGEAESEEEKAAVEAAVEAFEGEKSGNAEAIGKLEDEVNELERDLTEVEKMDNALNRASQEVNEIGAGGIEARDASTIGGNFTESFSRMNAQERAAVFMRDDVRAWIGEIREHISQKRELTNVGLTIPDVFLEYLRENVTRYSKLYKHVNVQRIGGTGREVIMGSVPEGVWTECCATLNELSLGFNDVEVNCFKVGGYFKVCNAILEDSDIGLASLLIDAIGQAIGLALDKAILYGRNTNTNYKMPLGVVPRLVQTEAPSDYPATARAWADLHVSNVKVFAASDTGLELFQKIVAASGAMKKNYARGEKVWVMNEGTYTALQVNAMSINAAGAIVSGQNGTMPVIGGKIETLDFIPDNVIIGGYFELYLLAERAGQKFAQSEHAFFIQDQTVFKGTARYDGIPVIPEAFIAIGLNGTSIEPAAMTFAADTANPGA